MEKRQEYQMLKLGKVAADSISFRNIKTGKRNADHVNESVPNSIARQTELGSQAIELRCPSRAVHKHEHKKS